MVKNEKKKRNLSVNIYKIQQHVVGRGSISNLESVLPAVTLKREKMKDKITQIMLFKMTGQFNR